MEERDRVRSVSELFANIRQFLTELETAAQSPKAHLEKGICFVAIETTAGVRFVPSRYAGYCKNTAADHADDEEKHGSSTNAAISKLVGKQPIDSPDLEGLYQSYCEELGVRWREFGTFGNKRRFWDLRVSL